jgi:hypothetical protein
LILAVAIRADQYLLRRNAERLLADLKSLEMRRSTYRDARQVMDRWSEEMHLEGPCQPYKCDARISLDDFFIGHQKLFANHQSLAYGLRYLYRLLGGRPATIHGDIRVRKNVVWGKGIRAVVVSHFRRTVDEDSYDYTLVGEAGSGSPMTISSLHPEYGVDSWAGCCIDAQVIFTPYTDPADVNRLMDIDFSCLTRRTPCKTQAEILPTAWNESVAEEKSGENSVQQICRPDVMRVLSRESIRVAVGEVRKTEAFAWGGDVTLRIMADLKPWNHRSSVPEDYHFNESLPISKKLGERCVVFFQYAQAAPYRVDRGHACDLVPVTTANMEVVRRGVAEDWKDRANELFPSSPGLRDVKPPAIGVR